MITIKNINEANKDIIESAYLLKFCRYLSRYFIVFLANKSLNPLVVNYLNLLIAIFALTIFALDIEHNLLIATVLLFIWQFIDTIDGGIARVRKIVNNYGGYIDYITGMIIIAFLPVCISIACINNSTSKDLFFGFISLELTDLNILAIGCFSSISSIFSRFINHTIKIRFGIDNSTKVKKDFNNIFSNILVNIENIGGLQLVFLLLAIIMNSTVYFLVVYAIINISIFIIVFLHSLSKYYNQSSYHPLINKKV